MPVKYQSDVIVITYRGFETSRDLAIWCPSARWIDALLGTRLVLRRQPMRHTCIWPNSIWRRFPQTWVGCTTINRYTQIHIIELNQTILLCYLTKAFKISTNQYNSAVHSKYLFYTENTKNPTPAPAKVLIKFANCTDGHLRTCRVILPRILLGVHINRWFTLHIAQTSDQMRIYLSFYITWLSIWSQSAAHRTTIFYQTLFNRICCLDDSNNVTRVKYI